MKEIVLTFGFILGMMTAVFIISNARIDTPNWYCGQKSQYERSK